MITNSRKKIFSFLILTLTTAVLVIPLITLADDYIPLAPLPDLGGAGNIKGDLGSYLQGIFKLGIGVAGVLAVLMLVIAGIEYMGTESITNKGDAKERMKGAVLGLLLALGSWLILNTISPNLAKNLSLNIQSPTPPREATGISAAGERARAEARIAELALRHNESLEQRRVNASGDAGKLNSAAEEYEDGARILEESSECALLEKDCLDLKAYYEDSAKDLRIEAVVTRSDGETRKNYQNALDSFSTLKANPRKADILSTVVASNELKTSMNRNYEDELEGLRRLQADQNVIDKTLTEWATRGVTISRNAAEAHLLGNDYTYSLGERGTAVKTIMDTMVTDTKAKMAEPNTSQAAKNEMRRTVDFALQNLQSNCKARSAFICANYQPKW